MKVLITGGSGFIGTNLVQFYIDQHIEVFNIDLKPPQNENHVLNWHRADLLNRTELMHKVNEIAPTHVIHLAARTDLNGTNIEDYAVNTVGTQNLIDSLSTLPYVQKTIFASTMLVCAPGYTPANETDYCPTTVYGESKKMMEMILRKQQLHFAWLVIRPTSIWGPWFGSPYRDFFDKVYQRQYFNIKNRACTKTYGFVLNAVFQINKLLHSEVTNETVFYLGDKPPLNIADWANQVALMMGYKKFPQVPYNVFRLAAWTGDFLKLCGMKFPMTSFRLKNMTTNNILPLDNLYAIAGDPPFDTRVAIKITLEWLKYDQAKNK